MPESLKPTHLASHHYNRSKPRKLLAIQQGGVIGIASESRDDIYDNHTNNFAKG
jgi:hypothetical protein